MASKVFPAMYQGECSECGDDIESGDPIRMMDGEPIHEDCYDVSEDDEEWEDDE